MNNEIDSDNDLQIPVPIFNIILFIFSLFFILIPSLLKLNKCLYCTGFIIAIVIMNFIITYHKVLYYDNSWYTQKYQYNKSHIYKETINKSSFNNFISSTYNGMKYILSPLGKGIKFIFYGEPKSRYRPKRKKYE